jgi:hypothetical protein
MMVWDLSRSASPFSMANSLVAFQQGHIFTNNWYSGFNPSSEWFPAANPNV